MGRVGMEVAAKMEKGEVCVGIHTRGRIV